MLNKENIYPSISLCFGNVFMPEKMNEYGVNLTLYSHTSGNQILHYNLDSVLTAYDYNRLDLI